MGGEWDCVTLPHLPWISGSETGIPIFNTRPNVPRQGKLPIHYFITIMLTDPVEIQIMSQAQQHGLRDPKCCHLKPFIRILDDFFEGYSFAGRCFLDLGPGQCDFGKLVEERGGKVVVVESDPAVVALSEHRGYRCYEGNLDHLGELGIEERFDGIFCKGSCNAFRLAEDIGQLHSFVESLKSLLKPDGWCWIAPWNGAAEGIPAELVERIEKEELTAYENQGFDFHELSRDQALHYGVYGATVNRRLFTIGLPGPAEHREYIYEAPSYPAAYLDGLVEWFASTSGWSYLTYGDLDIGKWDSKRGYGDEFAQWRESVKAGKDRHVLFQYDVDGDVESSHRILETHLRLDIPCNLMVFVEQFSSKNDYCLDFDLLKKAASRGFGIHYHCNVWERADFDEEKAKKLFRSDIAFLREKIGDIRHFSMHGGPLSPDGRANQNLVFLDEVARSEDLLWVHNPRAPRFHSIFDDGGPAHRNFRSRIGNPVDAILALRPRQRLRLLFHPQYYSAGFGEAIVSPAKTDFSWFQRLEENYSKAIQYSQKAIVGLREKLSLKDDSEREAERFRSFHWEPTIEEERKIVGGTLERLKSNPAAKPVFVSEDPEMGLGIYTALFVRGKTTATGSEFKPDEIKTYDGSSISFHNLLEIGYLCRNLETPSLFKTLKERDWHDVIGYLQQLEEAGIPAKDFGILLTGFLRSVGKINSKIRSLEFLGLCANYARLKQGAPTWSAPCDADFKPYAEVFPSAVFLALVHDVRDIAALGKSSGKGNRDLVALVRSWKERCQGILGFRETLANEVRILRGGDLADEPGKAVPELYRHLGIDVGQDPSYSAPPELKPGIWKEELDVGEAKFLSEEAGEVLVALGYEN